MFTLTNNGKAAHIFTLISGRTVSLPPDSQPYEHNISERVADQLRSSGVVKVVAHGYSPEPIVQTREKTQEPDTIQEDAPVESRTEEASDLINRYQGRKINFGEFQAEAKLLIGDKWPGGTPRKSEILEMLRTL